MQKINVTKTFLPPIKEYEAYLEKIWSSKWLTNQGPLLDEFEGKIKKYLEVENFQFVSNGTMAIQLAIRSLELDEGEIITTPFSYVATTSAILWEHFTPVYVDIDPDNFCIDVDKIEAAITSRTRAILAVHVFGFHCNMEKIESIAKKYNLKVIYDGAHAFGAKYKGRSLLDYGDISICSFHATKLFHTIEGGCIITKDPNINKKIDIMKRFGHNGDQHLSLGINAKASEFQAAMGLCNLKYIDVLIQKRKVVSKLYDDLLSDEYSTFSLDNDSEYNYAYYPIIFKYEDDLIKTISSLKKINIHPRRYFYPSLNTIPYVAGKKCPISESIASRILCLPLYPDLEIDNVKTIANIINSNAETF